MALAPMPAMLIGSFLRGNLTHGGGTRFIHVTHVASLEAIDNTVRFFTTTLDDERPYIAARMAGPQEAERELHALLLALSGSAGPAKENEDGDHKQ